LKVIVQSDKKRSLDGVDKHDVQVSTALESRLNLSETHVWWQCSMKSRIPMRRFLPFGVFLFLLGAPMGCGPKPPAEVDDPQAEELDGVLPEPIPGLRQVVCLFSDLREPYQRAQAQYLEWRDGDDESFVAAWLDARGDAKRQTRQLKQVLANPPEALLIQVIDASRVAPLLRELRKKKVFVIGMDVEEDGAARDGYDCRLMSNVAEIGALAAEVIVSALQKRAEETGSEGGRVAQLRGVEDHPWGAEVAERFQGRLAQAPEVVLVHDAPTDWIAEEATERMREALRIQKQVDVVFAHDDFMAQAAHRTAVAAGVREGMLIIGVNAFSGREGGVEMLRKQELDVTIYRPLLLDFAWDLLRQRTEDAGFRPRSEYRLPIRVFRPTDLDQPANLRYPTVNP